MKNVVVIPWDDVGVDQLGCYYPGLAGVNVTSLLDARAATGLRFRKHSTAPTCSPTRCTWMTGLSPHNHGVGKAIVPGSVIGQERGIDPSIATLPRALAAAGYQSIAVGKWHMAGIDYIGGQTGNVLDFLGHPIAMGFDAWEGLLFQPNVNVFWGAAEGYSAFEWWDTRITNDVQFINTVNLTVHTADRAIANIPATGPFFMYVCFNAAHAPVECPPSSLHDFGSLCGTGTTYEKTRATTQVLDRQCDRFIQALDLSTTVVIVVSDNGSPTGIIRGFPDDQAKATTYLGGIRTPLIAFGAGVRAGVSDALVQASDLTSTVLELAGIPGAMPGAVDSLSFAAHLSDSAAPTRGFSYSEGFGGNGLPFNPTPGTWVKSAEDQRYHLVRLGDDSEQMFDVQEDEFELSPLNLGALTPQQSESLRNLRAVVDSHGALASGYDEQQLMADASASPELSAGGVSAGIPR